MGTGSYESKPANTATLSLCGNLRSRHCLGGSNVNTNYFFNQTMGVNSLEKLHKTKFHYKLDMILTKGQGAGPHCWKGGACPAQRLGTERQVQPTHGVHVRPCWQRPPSPGRPGTIRHRRPSTPLSFPWRRWVRLRSRLCLSQITSSTRVTWPDLLLSCGLCSDVATAIEPDPATPHHTLPARLGSHPHHQPLQTPSLPPDSSPSPSHQYPTTTPALELPA